MWPAVFAVLRTYAPYITLPVSIVIGVVGYNIEGWISDKHTPTKKKSIGEERLERQLKEMEEEKDKDTSLKSKKFVPKTIFEKNLPPTSSTSDK